MYLAKLWNEVLLSKVLVKAKHFYVSDKASESIIIKKGYLYVAKTMQKKKN